MESGNGGASSEGFLIPVSESSDLFQREILSNLQSAYLYDESKQFFRYKSALLVKNPYLEEKYEAFRASRRKAGYSEDDLKETYGFLLFEDGSKANALGETGLIIGNSACTTLGDPVKGVYIPMYSDCLDLNRWYHGKSGYIAIIRLTKGKVKKVAENYTQNFTEPTAGFDCHVSDQVPSVSAKTSSFLAFERTQFYVYELRHDGSGETCPSPSAACPFAIVSFSYIETKASPVLQKKSEVKKQVHYYLPWRGQLQIKNQSYHIDLRSTTVGFIPVQLPSVIKVNKVLCVSVLRNLLPREVFETSYTKEVFLDGFYCNLCEFVSSEPIESSYFALLLSEIKEKDLALSIPLNDGGFLLLLHSSHFLRYDDDMSGSAEVMQGLFVFPDSRVVRRETKFQERNSALSFEILRVLPVLSYALGEAEKTSLDPKDELCEVLTQHMQSYATLINPGFSSSPSRPSRELSMFPDQFDVAEAHKHLYSSPEWKDRAWETLQSYLSKLDSLQLPVAKVSEILASGQEERRDELDDDFYICLSSPEEAPTSPACIEAEEHLSDQQSLGNIKTSMDIGFPSGDLEIPAIPFIQNIVAENLNTEKITKGDQKCANQADQPNKVDDLEVQEPLSSPTSEDLRAELIVSITSATQNVADQVITAKHSKYSFSGLSTISKVQTGEVNSVINESDKGKRCLDFSTVTKHQKVTKRRKRRRKCSLMRKVSKTPVKTQSLNMVISSDEVEHLNPKTQEHSEELDLPQLRNSLKPKWKKPYRRKRIFGTLSSKRKKLRSAAVSTNTEKKKTDVGLTSLKSPMLLGLEALPLRKKMERWDLKPIISKCGRILFPFGSVDFADQVKSMQCTKKDESLENMLPNVPVNLPDTVIKDKQPGSASAVAETTFTSFVNDENHQLNTGDSILTYPVVDCGQELLTANLCTPRDDNTNSFSPKTTETKWLESLSPVKLSAKGELLLSKLKSVLSRRKPNSDFTTEQNRETDDQGSDPCFKKRKLDFDTETSKVNLATCEKSVSVSKMVSVDPLFAHCLGLTPIDNQENVQNFKKLDTLPWKDSTEEKEHNLLDKQTEIIQRPLSIFPRRSRIKTLKRHQGVSAENVKKKCTSFQVQPISGSTRLLNHHQAMYGSGDKTLHPSFNDGYISEHSKTSEYLHKPKQKLKHTRTFTMKERSIQVTRKWVENYNFNLDSKFTSDPKDKVIIRALHGPWDLSVQDTDEEVRLIFHMWIGLFYSRSTSRFFQVDSMLKQSCVDESASQKVSARTLSDQTMPLPEIISAEALSSMSETKDFMDSTLMDLSKKENYVTESEILDLSVKNLDPMSVHPEKQSNKKVTSVSCQPSKASVLNPAAELQDKEPFQLIGKNDRILYHTKEMKKVPSESKTDETSFGIDSMFLGCCNDFRYKKVGIEDKRDTVPSLPQEDALCLPTCVLDKEVINLEGSSVAHTSVLDHLKLKGKESCQIENSPCQDVNIVPSLDMINRKEESVSKDSYIVHNGSRNKLLTKGSKPSPDKTDIPEGSTVCCKTTTAKELSSKDVYARKLDYNENESCISVAEIHRGLTNQSLPKPCDGLVKQSYISYSSQSEEQPAFLDGTDNALLFVNTIVSKEEISSFKTSNTPLEITLECKDVAPKENVDIKKTDPQQVVMPISDEGSCSFVASPTGTCFPLESPNKKEASDQKFYTCNDNKILEYISVCEEKTFQTLLEPQDSKSKSEVKNVYEEDEEFTEKDKDVNTNETSSRLSKSLNLVPNSCIAKGVARVEDQLSPSKVSILDETYTPETFRKDSRSPTPTIDEKPLNFNNCSSPSSNSDVLGNGQDIHTVTESLRPTTDELPSKQKFQTSRDETDPNPPCVFGSDVKTRTLRVLESLNKFFYISNNQKTLVDPDCNSYNSSVSGEVVQEEQKPSQSILSNDYFQNSERPVMAVKPSKSEESLAHWLTKDLNSKTTSLRKQASGDLVRHLPPTSMLVTETNQCLKENSDRLDSNHRAYERSYKNNFWENKTFSKSSTKKDTVDLLSLHQNKRSTSLVKLSHIQSLPPSSVQCSTFKECCPKLMDGHSMFVEYTINGNIEDISKHVNHRDCSDKSLNWDKDDILSEDGHIADPQISLKCTVFNTGQKRPYSFLEQISQRCLQTDLTQTSMEQECLIFSEKMKNLLKKSKRDPLYQPDTYNSSTTCTSPLTISFSRLDDEEDSKEFLDTALAGQKIQVPLPIRTDQTGFTEEEKVCHSGSQKNNNLVEHAGISAMTAECARLYNAQMHEVCSTKKITHRSKHKKGSQHHGNTNAKNHFDFFDQMKNELDETFHSNLNAVVRKSCKTKYRFYILLTSDEVFFEETKSQMEAEGHTAVQPSEFFIHGENSSSLLIILRNEDIAEHICKIPHLLKLKMTPDVLFAGVDEPHDVINLTHQELFIQAGFVMFDKAVFEPLSICNMEKISEILQLLSKMGKWKWIMHYRDSRRLKESARLSEEAKKKELFMYWCQDAGLLEVLPYHECDQMAKDQPDYLSCLLRLQVQHISSRFTVFITDAKTEGAFEKNGILTMTLKGFLTKPLTETFRV